MKVAILTTHDRDSLRAVTEPFWRDSGWEPVYYYNDGAHPGVGRNRILRDFYAGTDEWICISDDDNILDTRRGEFVNFTQNIDHVLGLAAEGGINTFGILNNIVHRVEITLTNPAMIDNWVWIRSYSLSNVFFHRRTEMVEFSEEYMMEDQEWCMDQLVRGQVCGLLMNVVMKTISTPSLLFQDNAERGQAYTRAREHWLAKYPGLKYDIRGRISKMPILKKYWPNPVNWDRCETVGLSFRRPK
jgi:hypothetical protein